MVDADIRGDSPDGCDIKTSESGDFSVSANWWKLGPQFVVGVA